MSLYRVKQFYWSISSKLNLEDVVLIERYLTEDERRLFNSLSVYEQKHSAKVAEAVIRLCEANNINNEGLIKAALLHDIGKIYKKLNPVEKSLLVMLDNISKGKLKKLKKLKKIDIYYNHADKGYNILKNSGKYDERFLYLIKNHHNANVIGDRELDILKISDNKN